MTYGRHQQKQITKENTILSCKQENIVSIYTLKFYQSFKNENEIKAFLKNTQDDITWILGDFKVSKLFYNQVECMFSLFDYKRFKLRNCLLLIYISLEC